MITYFPIGGILYVHPIRWFILTDIISCVLYTIAISIIENDTSKVSTIIKFQCQSIPNLSEESTYSVSRIFKQNLFLTLTQRIYRA